MFCASPRQLLDIADVSVIEGMQEADFEKATIHGVVIDSRRVRQDTLFIALTGERVDGNDYVQAAFAGGARAVVMTRKPSSEECAAARDARATLLYTSSGERFLQDLASWWRSKLQCLVIGVTGSSGKTTTKEMCAAVLATTFKTHATEGNYNSTLGAPLTILDCPLSAEVLVVEMGMGAAGEIRDICAVARPHVGIITNIGTAHIGFLGSRLNIARAKAELVEALPARACVLLWGEDDYTSWIADNVAQPNDVRVVTFGTSATDDVSCTSYEIDETGRVCGEVRLSSGAVLQLSLALPGIHNMIDALCACALGELLGVNPQDSAQALSSLTLGGNRQELIRCAQGLTILNDCYNANAQSMRYALDALLHMQARRHVACLGDMLELGDDAQLTHAAVGAYAAGKGLDVLVAVGPLSQTMARAAVIMGMPRAAVYEAADALEAAELLKRIVAPDDALLIKASHSIGLEQTLEAVKQCWE